MHDTRECKTSLNECYQKGTSDLKSNALNATGDFQDNVAEAEKLYTETMMKILRAEAEAKDKKKENKGNKKVGEQNKPARGGFAAKLNPSGFATRQQPAPGTGYVSSSSLAPNSSRADHGRPNAGSHNTVPSNANAAGFSTQQDPDAKPVDYKYFKQFQKTKIALSVQKEDKIYNTKTKTLGNGAVSVLTNFVHIAQVPDTLYVYEISNSHQGTNRDGSAVTTVYKKKELQSIFETAFASALGPLLGATTWATDHTTIWTTSSILPDPNAPFTHSIDYVVYGGHLKQGMVITISPKTTLRGILGTLQQKKAVTVWKSLLPHVQWHLTSVETTLPFLH